MHAKVAGGQQNRAQYINDNMGGNGNSAGSITASAKESDGIVNFPEFSIHNSKRNYIGQQNQKARQSTACNGEPPCLYCPILETRKLRVPFFMRFILILSDGYQWYFCSLHADIAR